MLLNSAARILKNLLLTGIDDLLLSVYNRPTIAISPIATHDNLFHAQEQLAVITLTSYTKKYPVVLSGKNFLDDEIIQLCNHLESNIHQTELLFSILFKKKHSILIETETDNDRSLLSENNWKRIDISILTEEREIFLTIAFPLSLLQLFSRKITVSTDSDTIDSELRGYFANPINLFPSLKTILETFSDIELQTLLNQLQKRNLLTVYQICLIVLAIPEHSLRLKRNLSTNTVHDVMDFMTKIKKIGFIRRRDLVEGIYSIEEAIYFLMRGNEDIGYSKFLSQIQDVLKTLSSLELLLVKDFSQWLDEIDKNGLLYKTLTTTSESIIAQSISSDWNRYKAILGQYISERKLSSIHALIQNKTISFSEVLSSQATLVRNYRKIRIHALNLGYESFDYLLSLFTRPYDYSHLLLKVGWFVLSTSLKGMKKKKTVKLLEALPKPARYIIEDVLRGVINPNIIHDELQIRRARSLCVKSILLLYEDGVIHLSY